MKQGLPTFRIFGLTLASDFAFANPLAPAADCHTPDVTFNCSDRAPRVVDWQALAPAYASPDLVEDGESLGYLYRLADFDVLRFTGVADFYLWPDRIVCHLLDPACAYLVEIYLLGAVLSTFLERRGIPVLHASAVVVDRQAVAFLASNRGGKSALAATLVQAGHPLLTDDILPVEPDADRWLGLPGYPAMRMWPDEAQHFLGRYKDLEIVHPQLEKRRVCVGPGGFGAFCAEARPLACIYVPERRDPDEWGETVRIEPLRPTEALMALVRHSFTPRLAEAMGLQRHRLSLLVDLLQRVPIRRLIYPSGFERLPLAREVILQDR